MPISVSALNRGRRTSNAGMPDRCVARAETGATEWDAEALAEVPVTAELYAGRCELKWSEQVTTSRGGVTVEGYVLKVPATAAVLTIGAAVEIVASRSDPAMPGSRFVVKKLLKGSHLMSRRYQVVEATGPNG